MIDEHTTWTIFYLRIRVFEKSRREILRRVRIVASNRGKIINKKEWREPKRILSRQ